MTHYPSHERKAFLGWLNSGCPETAVVEENYQPCEITADEMLRRFASGTCSDVMPKEAVRAVIARLGAPDIAEHYRRNSTGLTYAMGAAALLVQRTAGDDPARKFLARLLDVEQEPQAADTGAAPTPREAVRTFAGSDGIPRASRRLNQFIDAYRAHTEATKDASQ